MTAIEQECTTRMYARSFADIMRAQLLQEQRIAALVDRMQTAERDIESLQKYFAAKNAPRGTPTLWPYPSASIAADGKIVIHSNGIADNIIRPV